MNNTNNKVQYSKTIEEVVLMLETFQKEHGSGGLPKYDNQDWKDGYARAITDLLWIIS